VRNREPRRWIFSFPKLPLKGTDSWSFKRDSKTGVSPVQKLRVVPFEDLSSQRQPIFYSEDMGRHVGKNRGQNANWEHPIKVSEVTDNGGNTLVH